jgi:hypothetical protein
MKGLLGSDHVFPLPPRCNDWFKAVCEDELRTEQDVATHKWLHEDENCHPTAIEMAMAAQRVHLDPHPYDEDVPECPSPDTNCVVCPYYLTCHPIGKEIPF